MGRELSRSNLRGVNLEAAALYNTTMPVSPSARLTVLLCEKPHTQSFGCSREVHSKQILSGNSPNTEASQIPEA